MLNQDTTAAPYCTAASQEATPSQRGQLIFRPLTLADVPAVNALLQKAPSRTCDFSLGGIYMWIDRFRYSHCIIDNTLFIKGVSEIDPSVTAFSLPAGPMPLDRAVAMIERYCHSRGIAPVMSAVPEDCLEQLLSVTDGVCRELEPWADYLYAIDELASLSGKKLNKKRNHVNRFKADNPNWELRPLTADNLPQALSLLEEAQRVETEGMDADDDALHTAVYEHQQCRAVLENRNVFPFEGVLLYADPEAAPVAFAVAEVIGDTAFVHIEKMLHSVAGAGEAVAHLFARHLKEQYPQLQWLNREEDCGDEGLRRAKESWHPAKVLRKFDVYL